MHRFFLLDVNLQVSHTVDLTPIAYQLSNVLRLQPGAQITLLDGTGFAFTTEITHLTRNQGTGTVVDKRLLTTEPWTYVTLYQCSLKADKFEWVLQKGTELGISQFVPVISERSVVRPASAIQKKYQRWQKIIQEAAEQCGRGRIPRLAAPQSYEQALVNAEGLTILPWEEAVADTRAAGKGEQEIQTRRLEALLSSQAQAESPPTQISLLIGPEGGLSGSEAHAAQEQGWAITSLGPRILRAETAAIATAAIIMHTFG